MPPPKQEAVNSVLATVGAVSTVANGIKSYELRSGRPKEVRALRS